MNFYDWAQTILAYFGEVVGLRISVYRQSDRVRTLDVDNDGNASFGASAVNVIGTNNNVANMVLTVVNSVGAARIYARGTEGEIGAEDMDGQSNRRIWRWRVADGTWLLERVTDAFDGINGTPMRFDGSDKVGISTSSIQGMLHVTPVAASVPVIVAQTANSQGANALEVRNFNNSVLWRVDQDQVWKMAITSLPSTLLLQNNEAALWWDQANGYLAILAKNSAGALKVGRVTMS